MSRTTVMPAPSSTTAGSPATVSQARIEPNINVFPIRQKAPSRRQRQERKGGRAMLGKMLNAHRLVEIVCLRSLSAGPQIPATDAAFRLNAHAVEWLQVQRLDGDSHSGTCKGRKKLGTVLVAHGFLLGIIHRCSPQRTQGLPVFFQKALCTSTIEATGCLPSVCATSVAKRALNLFLNRFRRRISVGF